MGTPPKDGPYSFVAHITQLHSSLPTSRFTESEIEELGKGNVGSNLLWALHFRQDDAALHSSITAFDLVNHRSQAYPPALVRAAKNPDSSILKSLLSLSFTDRSFAPSAVPWWEGNSPLRGAVRAGALENVRLLLDHGADPNGVTLSALSSYSAQFIGFRPRFTSRWLDRAECLEEIARAEFPAEQDGPLIGEEIEERKKVSCCALDRGKCARRNRCRRICVLSRWRWSWRS